MVRAIALLTALVGAGGCYAENIVPEQVKASGEHNARSWAEDLGLEVVGVSCSSSDSDADGYVSCTVNTGAERVPIQCNYGRSILGRPDSCKEARVITVATPSP